MNKQRIERAFRKWHLDQTGRKIRPDAMCAYVENHRWWIDWFTVGSQYAVNKKSGTDDFGFEKDVTRNGL
jgi:hypothetical protein